MINTAWTGIEVRGFVGRLKLRGFKVHDFGSDGYASEVDGQQVFRATNMGNEHFSVRYNESMFPDV